MLGTDAERIRAAIERAMSEDGVLVLMDLGSALMSSEMALELLAERPEKVRLSEAPLVEGAVAAAAAAKGGASLEQVADEARGALRMKESQLGVEGSGPAESPETSPAGPPDAEASLAIRNAIGLHARPAARLIEVAGSFDASRVDRQGGRRRPGEGDQPDRCHLARRALRRHRARERIGPASPGGGRGAAGAGRRGLRRRGRGASEPGGGARGPVGAAPGRSEPAGAAARAGDGAHRRRRLLRRCLGVRPRAARALQATPGPLSRRAGGGTRAPRAGDRRRPRGDLLGPRGGLRPRR